MIQISKNANKNYLAKVVVVHRLEEIEGADFIQLATEDFNQVVVSKEVKLGDVMLYFPVECEINSQFLSAANLFRAKELLNHDPADKGGFFDSSCRVKSLKLFKGTVQSMGFLIPVEQVNAIYNVRLEDFIGEEFDVISGVKLVKKYEIPQKQSQQKGSKKPKVSRIIEGQVHLHEDTLNLRVNAEKISPDSDISITYKTHGTSGWLSHVLVKKRLTWGEKLLKKLGVNIVDTEYDFVYGSRKVVKNKSLEDPKRKDHFFGYDLWKDVIDSKKLMDNLPKGFSIYYEILGYDKNGKAIQGDFDYGCQPKECRIEVYRVTQTNEDGIVTELTHSQLEEFCERAGLPMTHTLFNGKAYWVIPEVDKAAHDWTERFVAKLEEDYNEKDCFMCMNKVPEEGVVVRVEELIGFKAYKLKSKRFLNWESEQLDKGEVDIESQN